MNDSRWRRRRNRRHDTRCAAPLRRHDANSSARSHVQSATIVFEGGYRGSQQFIEAAENDGPAIAAKKILDGERPPRPADAVLDASYAGTSPLWALHVECTARGPAARRALAAIVPRLDALLALQQA
jgi:hypothetical protein